MEPNFIRPCLASYLADRTQRGQLPSGPGHGRYADQITSPYPRRSLATIARRASGTFVISIGERLQGIPRMAYADRAEDTSGTTP